MDDKISWLSGLASQWRPPQPQNTFSDIYFPYMSLFTFNDKFCVIYVQCDCTVNMNDQHIGLCNVLS